MSKTLVSVGEVKNALKIDSFRNLSKDKIMEFVSLIPNMDKEVAIKIIEQYPAFAKLSESMVAQLNKMCDTALEKNEESQRLTIQAYKQILDELSNQLHMEDISKEEREKITKQMIDLDMKNSELMEKAEVSRSTFYKMKNSENITTDVIVRICDSLNCGINEIMELVNDENN